MNFKKIMVLGCNSFSGSNFVNFCLEQNKNVLGISRSSINKNYMLKHLENKKRNSKFKFINANINTQLNIILSSIKQFKPEVIVNFIAQGEVRNSWKYPNDWYETNCMSVVKLTSKIYQHGFIKKYLAISTPEVYGSSKINIDENNCFNPSTPYAASKLSGDLHLLTLFKKYNFPVVFTRSSNVYGEHQQLYRIIPKTIINLKKNKKITLHGLGNSKRDFIHIYDVCSALYKIIENGKLGETYHISSKNKLLSIKKLVKIICKKMNKNFKHSTILVNENFGQDFVYDLNSEKLRKKLNWNDKINLEDGIDYTINWINQNWSYIKKDSTEYKHIT
jgi:dTDP-glucose 4,6-dehydratase